MMETTKSRKQFSIILPAHNAEKRLAVPLQSIISQCYDRDKFEIIVVCDACDDLTSEVARQYGADKIVITDYGNCGMARQEGMKLVEGEWVLFMDDDDYWLHEFVLKTLERYARNDDFDVLIFSFIFGERGIALPFDNCGMIFPNVWSKMWRRSFIGDTEFRNVYPNDDELFCLDVFEKKPRVRVSEAVLYYYNFMRPGSITDTERKKRDACEE